MPAIDRFFSRRRNRGSRPAPGQGAPAFEEQWPPSGGSAALIKITMRRRTGIRPRLARDDTVSEVELRMVKRRRADGNAASGLLRSSDG